MEISTFSEMVPLLSNFWRTIPTTLQLKLESSLTLLKQDHKLNKLFFLGRLEAHSINYLLAFGTPGVDLFHQRKFYYSRDGIDWLLLLEPANWSEDWGRLWCEFTGNVGFGFKIRSLAAGSASVVVSEQDRLWYVMHAILREAAGVPRGALRMSTDQQIVLNPFFQGLTRDELGVLGNYQHFRRPERSAEENLRGRNECNLSMDVFDSLESTVLPEGKSFTLRMDDSDQLAMWSSLHWLGLDFFHKANSSVFGFLYNGDGRKNWDLPFMVEL
ncbi:radial spoke head protein 9 homolog [Anopheles maculipalpis]|uniref:radial spoke head protein 9 homolog n=1 Tax=Anopheles maculipalpis TaxID=1496333 RepID=UPI0021596849|nr:radial spoke head protein 9 homolog [Anopheles maculipalpis]